MPSSKIKKSAKPVKNTSAASKPKPLAKKTAAPAKGKVAAKAPVKKAAAPVKAKAPAKKAVAVKSKPAAKAAPKNSAPAKAVKKPIAKSAKPVAKSAKPVAKKVAKPAAKVPAKAVKKPAKPAKSAKPVAKAGKPAVKVPAKVAAKAKPEAKASKKTAVAAKTSKDVPAKKGKAVEPELPTGKGKSKAAASADALQDADLAVEGKKTKGRKAKAEVPAAESGEDNRTDRQKARDRKAKEKALLKEFAAQQLGSEEQQELRRARLKTLIKMGKSKGYLTHGEMNDVMSDELSDADALETLIGLLNDIGITVYEQAPDAETLLLNENGISGASDEEAEEEAEAALSTVDSEFGRTTDPVRMYMREMGTVDLLTREGEIVIAKKIEAGLKDMVMALSACPVTIAEIVGNADKIVSGEMEIDQFVDGLVDPNAEDIQLGPDEPEEDLEAIEGDEEGGEEDTGGGGGGSSTASAKQLEELKQISLEKFAIIRTQADKMLRAYNRDGYNCPAYIKAQEAIRNEMLGFRLTAKSVERLCDTMRSQVDQVWKLERGIVSLLVDKIGVSRGEVLKDFPKMSMNLKWTTNLLQDN